MLLNKSNLIKPQFLPIHTCVEQSPVCLIPEQIGPCQHKHCLLAHKKPQWWGISIKEFYNQEQFNQFGIHKEYGNPHIIPKNPNPGTKDCFEGFRQSMNAIMRLAGKWPVSLDVVTRNHVEFRWTEFMDEYPYTNPGTFETIWLQRLDVQEYAFYTGPIDGANVIDVNVMIIQSPTKSCTLVITSPKDWCHCGSEGDWCGEGCYQPQNKESVLALEKGGCNGK